MLAMYIATPFPLNPVGNTPLTLLKSHSVGRFSPQLFMLEESTALSYPTPLHPGNVRTAGGLATQQNTTGHPYDAHCAATQATHVPLAKHIHELVLIAVARIMSSIADAQSTNLKPR